MTKITSLLLLPVLLFCFAAAGRSRAQRPAGLDRAAVDRFITAQMAAQRIPGLALAITQGEQALYVKGYGTAGNGQPVTAQTQFFIASVSKAFTALAVMQQVEAGRIDLDAPVQRYLPEFTLADPAAASQITIRHLITNTSGLAETGYADMAEPQPATITERVTSLRSARPVARPGTEYHYFSPNFGILARVVEVVSGQPFAAYLETHIFQPLGMQHTISAVTFREGLQKADRLAQGHLLAFGIPIPRAGRDGYLGGSGGVITTAEDLAPFLIAQLNGGRYRDQQLVQPESITRMQTPPGDVPTNYAMSWSEINANGQHRLMVNGILATYSADVTLLPEEDLGIALLYNISSLPTNALAHPQIRDGVIALLAGEQPQTSPVSVGLVGAITALLTLAGSVLGARSLVRLPAWKQKARTAPRWKLLPGILWAFVPAVMLVWGIPAMTARFGGRVFGFVNLYESMLGIFTWLALTGALGILNSAARIGFLLRRADRSQPSTRAVTRAREPHTRPD